MDQIKLHVPSKFEDADNNLISNPKLNVSSFNVKIGDYVKDGDILYTLQLINPKELDLIYPIKATSEYEGYVSDIFYDQNETVQNGSAIIIINKKKQELVKKWENRINASVNFDWQINNKLYEHTDNFLKTLDTDFSQILSKKEAELKVSVDEQILNFKNSLGSHYNFFEQLFIDNKIEKFNINDQTPHSLPLGHFDLSIKNINNKIINLIDFPIGNIALTSDNIDELPFLHELIIQSITSLLINIKPNLINIKGISFKDFGFALNSLGVFQKKFFNETIFDEQEFEKFCEEIEDRIIEVRKKCLTEYDTLIEFNNDNPDRAEPYYFIFCSIDDEFPSEAKEKLLKFLNSKSIANAGIFFYVISLSDLLIGTSYNLNITIKKINSSFKNATINLTAKQLDLSHLNKLDLKYSLLPKKIFSALVNNINEKEDLIILDPFIEEESLWFQENTSKGIKVPIGYAPDGNIDLIIGHNTTNYNVLIGGGVGSGKSVLLHNIILGIATRYDPNECLFLLLDYKEGTEFLPYQNLPHAHVLSTESDPVFGLRTLEYINDEIEKRGKLFKDIGVSNISKYRSESKKTMPRWVIIIDEFQRMFQDQSVMSKVEKLFDDLNRRGRAFGIHFILATQSIYDLNMTPATLSQLSVRICLKISEMDASKILHVDNLIPSTFDKPGMGIYNNNIGLIDSNSQMQVPFIDGTNIKNTISKILNKNKIKTINHISKGQQFEKINPKNIDKNSHSVIIGCLQDIQKTYFKIDVDPKVYSPILVIGNEKQKLKLIFNSFVRDHLISNKGITISCLDFHPLNMDNITTDFKNKDKLYKYSEDEGNFFKKINNISEEFTKSKTINLLLILGLDDSLKFKENSVDDIGSQTDNKTKEQLLKIIRERLSLNTIPIVFIRKFSSFTSVFESLNYENSVSSDIFTRRIFMDTPQEFNYDFGNLSKYKVFYQDLDKSSQQVLTIFE